MLAKAIQNGADTLTVLEESESDEEEVPSKPFSTGSTPGKSSQGPKDQPKSKRSKFMDAAKLCTAVLVVAVGAAAIGLSAPALVSNIRTAVSVTSGCMYFASNLRNLKP